MPGARKLIIAQMARIQSPDVYSSMKGPRKSRFRSREYTLGLLAGLFVLACLFYSRKESGLRATPTEALPNEPVRLPPSVDASADNLAFPAAGKVEGAGKNAALSPGQSATGAGAGAASSSSSFSSGSTDLTNDKKPGQPATTLGLASLTPESPRAVIIESEMIPNLIPIMLHVATVLGPSWGMILFTLQDRWIEPLSPAFQRHVASGRIEVRFLPKNAELTSSHAVSRFLTSPWLWEQLAKATRVLLFQSDSVLCSKSQVAVEDYFQYDYVGAPIDPIYGAGYNGGLSIRNPRVFLQVTKEVDFASSGQSFEDQFFYLELQKRGAEMPAEEVAKTFAVETVFYETPLGYHQPQRWQAERMEEIENWCPEVKMLIGRRAG